MIKRHLLTICLCVFTAFAAASPAEADTEDALISLTAEARNGRIDIRLTAAGTFDAPVTQVLIDADGDAKTGLLLDEAAAAGGGGGAGGGFDLLVEGEQVHRFAGESRREWTWAPAGTAKRRIDGRTLTLTIARDFVPGRRAGLFARTLAADYQVVLGRAPRQGVSHIELPEWVEGHEAAGDADDAARDVTAVTLVQDAGDAVITVTMREPSDFANVLIFLARPEQAAGYLPTGADKPFGLLINGATLHEHTGDDPAAWAWSPLGTVDRHVNGSTLTLRVDAGLLAANHVRVGVWSMSGDWLSLVDRAPDRGLYDLKLDLSQVRSQPKAAVELAAPKANRHLPPRQRTAQMDDFYVYYGSGEVAALSHYDVAITHSPQMKPQDIAALTRQGVVMVGYITVGEDDKLRKGDGTGPGGHASWYFDRDHDNQPDQNAIWKSWFADANDPTWRADRVAEARRLVEEEGYDGIFLDTIDTVSRYPDTEDGMVRLVAEFRAALPDAVIILNQGYSVLDRLAPYADGFMLESFTATYDFQSNQYMLNTPSSLDWHARKVQRQLLPVLERYPLKVLVLDYALPGDTEEIQAAADRAATFGFHFAAAPIHLDQVYHLDIRGRHDPKWLQKQATPELLSITLDRTVNGLPKGTRVVPSGTFGGYRVDAVVDGIRDRAGLHWSEAAWASAEDGEAAWLELRFPQPIAGGELVITWAEDGGVLQVSRNYRVQVRADDDWHTVGTGRDEAGPISAWPLPDTPFTAARITQPPDGGSATRPNLLWIAQVERRTGE